MARHSKEYNNGYQAAIEAIKKQLSQSGGSGGSSNSDLENLPQPGDNNQSGNNNQSGGENSRDSKNGNNQGVVRPEDCIGPSQLNNIPNTPGTMVPKEVGDQIANQEGYDKEGGGESQIEQDWKDAALKAANKMQGDGAGKLKSQIEGLYKTSKDWKKELRKVVGMSISPDDKRQAYANKNILISQDRIARTDKDKYDNLDYMMAWVDSSGSMSDDQLKMCLSEVYSVALAKKPIKLIIIQCDTQIQDIKEYTDLKQLKKDMIKATVKGRGGTNLKPCWELLIKDNKYKRRPAELVMVFTDGYLTQYKRNPKTMRNLCWVILDNPSFKCEYKDVNTKVVYIDTSQIK